MKVLYAEYIQSKNKNGVWAVTSLRSESNRLNRFWDFIDGDPGKLWNALTRLSPYTRTTYWTRVSAFWDWAIKNKKVEGPNPYTAFREDNVQCFRNTYLKKPCKIPMSDLKAKIESIPAEYEDIKNAFRLMANGALRRCELHSITDDGYVKGKGGKVRKTHLKKPEGPLMTMSRYSTALKLAHKYLGVTPHKIRSAKATTMARKPDITPKDLMVFMGWSSIDTADSYIAENQELIEKLAKED